MSNEDDLIYIYLNDLTSKFTKWVSDNYPHIVREYRREREE